MVNAYTYSNTAIQTTLTGSISNVSLVITVGATTGFPVAYPYILALDYGGPAEELVKIISAAGTTLTIDPAGRGFGGTSAQSHSLGAVVRHVYNAIDATDFRTHEAAVSGVHGVAGSLVGTTDVQTLTNKTLTAPTITGPTITGGGSWAGSPTINTPTITSPSITGTVGGAASYTGITATNPTITGTVAGGASYTAPTITSPSITGTVSGGAVYLFPITQADVDANPSIVARRRSATQTGALINFRDETNTSLSFVASTGIARWRAGMSAGSADQLSIDTSGNLTTTGTLTSGNHTVNGNLTVTGVGQIQVATKSANQTVTSSTVFVNDTHLVLPMVANATYLLDGFWPYDGAFNAGEIKYQWTLPAAATIYWTANGPASGGGALYASNSTSTNAVLNLGSYGTGGAQTNAAPLGRVVTGANAGNLQLQWAQNTSNATPTTMYAGAWMRLLRIA